MPPTSTELVRISAVSKSFSGVKALSDVGFSIERGEVVCLAGENGSGKSTLIKILAGVEQPNGGTIDIDGKSYQGLSPRESIALGIQVIFQDFSLFPNLTVAENIALSAELASGRKLVRPSEMRKLAEPVLKRVGIDLDLNQRVDTLPVADKQLIAICRALVSDARLIIMDEPTSAITGREVKTLLDIIRRLRDDGVSVLFVSHKLAEVLDICDKFVVLRNGQLAAEGPRADFDFSKLSFAMTGRKFETVAPPLASHADVVMRLKGLTRQGSFHDINLDLRAGEVLGITGLLGCGRTALAKAMFGLCQIDGGTIEIEGKPAAFHSPRDAIHAGIGYVPEDRLTEGLFLAQSIARNVMIGRVDAHSGRSGFLDRAAAESEVRQWLDDLKIVAASPDAPAQSLSGGNQQRVVLARWLATRPKVLILNGPTIGVDIGSKADIHAIIARLAGEGMGVVLISDDVPEIMASCQRILIMKDGAITEELAAGQTDENDLAARLAA